jgi:DNA-binding transcriptional LysR family regulator
MQIRQLEYLTTLARERHFGRAAKLCNVSQPALSQAIRQMEASLGVPIIDRHSQGFHGFTPEGQRVLAWAQRALADYQQLGQELSTLGDRGLSGHLRIGLIPVTTPIVSILTSAFHRVHPSVTISILSQSFVEIHRQLERFELDVGISYLDTELAANLRPYVLYRETYYLLAPAAHPLAQRRSITWRETSALPLCLLTPDMLNRLIVNRIFTEVGVTAGTVIETNCAVTLCSHVRSGQWFTIVPDSFFYLIGDWNRTVAVPLVEPAASNEIGLLIHERDPLPPLAKAFVEVAQDVSIADELRKVTPARVFAADTALQPADAQP